MKKREEAGVVMMNFVEKESWMGGNGFLEGKLIYCRNGFPEGKLI